MTKSETCKVSHGEGGYALVLVLLAIALLSLLVKGVLVLSSSSVRNATSDFLRAQSECAAEAGMTEGMSSLVEIRPSAKWPTDGTPRDIVFQGISVRVTIEDEYGKIDLNGASRQLILGLFTSAGLDQSTANTLADRVLDWREPGNLKRLNGAKSADYLAAGLLYGPRDGPFESIGELRLVLGMSHDVFKKIEPGITVYNILPGPALQSAPPIVLKATGMSQAVVANIISLRAQGVPAPSGQLLLHLPSRIIGLPGTVFTISARASTDGITVTRTEIIRFTGNPKDPFLVLSWN